MARERTGTERTGTERTGTERTGRERKSLIEPVLAPAGDSFAGGDVLSRIIANDRERRRREEAPHPEGGPSPADGGAAPGDAAVQAAPVPGPAPAGAAPDDGSAPDAAPESAGSPEASPVTGNERTNVTTLQRTNVTGLQVTRAESEGAETEAGGAPSRRRRRGVPAPGVDAGTADALDADVRAERLGKALSLAAADEVSVVTVRVSAKLNEYMDRYVDRLNRVSPKRRYRKQDAVAEAFAAFFADHPLPPAPAEEEL